MTSLQRTLHRNLVTGAALGGSTVHREILVDIEDYLEPITAVRTQALHGPGIATGLRVTATANQPGLQIATGVAIDQRGRTVALQDGGVAVTARDADATTARNVPTVAVDTTGVTLDTAGLTGDRLLTLAWAEAEAGQGTLLRHAPWLQLLPADDPAVGVDAVTLARVTLDPIGAVTALTAGTRTTLTDRLELQAIRASGPPALAVDQTPTAELRARPDGGLDITPAGAASPALSVLGTGALTATTDLTVTGAFTAARSSVATLTATSLTATSLTAASVSAGTLSVDGAATLTGATTVGGALTAALLTAGALTINGSATVSGGLRIGAGGGVLNHVTVGTAGDAPVANPPYPWDYETVGVNRPEHNLRLRSPNVIAAHTYDPGSKTYPERVRIDGESTVARLTIGPGANGRLWTRHIDGKHWQQDTNDGLYLNWDTGQPVVVGGGARADLRVSGDAVVGAGGSGTLTLRHVNGKSHLNDGADDLYLNWGTGRGVHVGGAGIRKTPDQIPLHVHGELHADAAIFPTGVNLPHGGTVASAGRMHLSGEEMLFLLNKQGVAVSGAWGGNGQLHVDGNLGSAGKHPVDGLPTGWGGGVHTWDVFAEGSIGCGPAGVNGSDVPAGLDRDGAVWGRSKHFVIDHPLDPENRRLAHGCIEGPEIGVYYRGSDRLVDGRARVVLPAYFEALVRAEGRTVLLTPIAGDNEPVSMLAAGIVGDGGFDVCAIDGSNPSQRFYWEVKAVRADIEPLLVERRKNEDGILRRRVTTSDPNSDLAAASAWSTP